MKMNTKFAKLAILILLLSFVVGCGKNTNHLNTVNEQYFDSLQGMLDDCKVDAFSEDTNGIYLSVSDPMTNKNVIFDEVFADLLEEHNTFVKNNIEYFPENFAIRIEKNDGGRLGVGYCNKGQSIPWIDCDISVLGITENNHLKYSYTDLTWAYYQFYKKECKCREEVEVLVVECVRSNGGLNDHIGDYWIDLIDLYPNLRKLLIVTDWDYDSKDVGYETIRTKYPDLEIYTLPYGDELIYYE